MSALLEMNDVSKRFLGVHALKGVHFDLRCGEVHALVGENGAGKSTLMKVLTGIHQPDSGEIFFEGKPYAVKNIGEAQNLGISMIHQELNMMNDLTVAQNVFIGRELKKGPWLDDAGMVRETQKIFDRIGIKIDPKTKLGRLTVGKQQMVEIAKAVSRDCKLLILDEPTAALTQTEIEDLFRIMGDLKAKGIGMVYISHRMDEIFELADRITVMRDGEVIKTVNKEDTNKNQLIYDMVGRKLTETYPERHPKLGKTLLEVKNLCGSSNEETTFSVREGEIVGLAGLVGAGRTEIARLIIGADKKYSGTVCVDGKEVAIHSPKDAIQHGIAYVSEDRKNQGVLLKMSIRWNITLPILRELSKMTFINFKEENKCVDKYKDALRIKTPSINQLVGNLSGGNQQKVAVAKWLASESKILILDEPTRGIDVGAKQEIYELINRLTDEGLAIIMISSEMEEIMGMSDRMLVMAEGRIVGELDREEFSQNQIMKYASNITD